MYKQTMLFNILLLLTLMVACAGGVDDEATDEPTEEGPPTTPPVTLAVPTEELPVPAPTAYPGFSTPSSPGENQGYPVTVPLPPHNPYPGGLATILHPLGLQCEDPVFPDISAAINSLEGAGIVVVAAEEIGLEVCEACGCATSTHFQLQIHAENLDTALEMGWERRTFQ